ncbi:MAG: hypothetical protein QXN55_08760 [Candidatus Nitrosotenuis sp.]
MEPIKAVEQTLPIIERGGVVAAVIICCAIIVVGMTMAVVVLWKGREAALVMIQEIQANHYKQMLEESARNMELKKQLADTLESHVEAIKSLCEKMAVVADRVGRI